MELSDNGARLVAKHEGLELEVYLDTKGIPTIGIGHRILPGEDFTGGITEAQAYELFRADAAEAIEAINQLVKVPLTQNQFDALVDFVFNIGQGHFAKSTLLHCLNASLYAAAAEQFEQWNIPAVIISRREDERALFETA